MRAIVLDKGNYILKECAAPSAGKGEVLIDVAYAGVNRADLLQKQGKYPLPQSAPNPIPGMEVSGTVAGCGQGVNDFKTGDKVCALVSEGAYGERVAVNAQHVLPMHESLTLEAAAALPEACFTVWISLVWQGRLQQGEMALIHGGSSGIGTIAIQVAKHLGARVFATARTEEKCALVRKLGAHAIAYTSEDFVAVVKEHTQGKGVNVILDMVGGDYFARNLEALAHGGRLAIIAFLKGAKVEANLGAILLKHLSIMGSTLRSRPAEEKTQLAREIKENIWDAVGQGTIKPVIDRIFPLEQAEKALQRMDQGLNIGKILLKI